MDGRERRAHARVAVPLRARIESADWAEDLALRDISKGGAFLYTSKPPVKAGDSVRLAITFPGGREPLGMLGEVARVVEAPASEGGGTLGIGIRFASTDAATAARLDQLLVAAVRGPGGERRATPRIAALLHVECRTDKAMDAIMRDISRGGMGITTDRPLSAGDKVEVHVRPPSGVPLTLGGTVRRVDAPRAGEMYRSVGIQFNHLGEATRAELDRFLDDLAKS